MRSLLLGAGLAAALLGGGAAYNTRADITFPTNNTFRGELEYNGKRSGSLSGVLDDSIRGQACVKLAGIIPARVRATVPNPYAQDTVAAQPLSIEFFLHPDSLEGVVSDVHGERATFHGALKDKVAHVHIDADSSYDLRGTYSKKIVFSCKPLR